MMAKVLELSAVYRQFARVKQMHADIDERDEQQQVKRSHYVRAEQRCELAQAEDPRDENDEYRRESDGRIDPDHHAERQAPRQPSWRDASAEQAKKRTQDVAAKPLAYRPGHQHTCFDAPRRNFGRLWLRSYHV